MVIEMPTSLPTDSNIIKDPFFNEKDYDKVPYDTIPEDIKKTIGINAKNRITKESDFLKKVETGLQEFSKCDNIEEMFLQEAHRTISSWDDHVIKVVLHTGLSAYLKPLNLGLKAESGSGKSYSTIQTLKFLPDEDIEILGSQSPKVISHQLGVKKTPDGEEIGEPPEKPSKSNCDDSDDYGLIMDNYKILKTRYDEKNKKAIYEVDLRNRVYVFLENFNVETFQMFKATMSSDNEYIDHKYVDDKGNVHITRLVGSPALIYNCVDTEYLAEQATRSLTATPSSRAEKLEDSMRISNQKSCYPWMYKTEQLNKQIIKEYIRKVKQFIIKGELKVANPFDGIKEIFSKEAVRDMRDFNKYLELLPSYALLYLFQRPIVTIHGSHYVIPTIKDAINAKTTFDAIIETTRTSTDFRVTEFYWKVISKAINGLVAEEATDKYNLLNPKHKKSTNTIRRWINRLEEIGYIDSRQEEHKNDKGYIDRRYIAYYPLKKKEEQNGSILSIEVDLNATLKKAFEKWLKTVLTESDYLERIILLKTDGTAETISLEDLIFIITGEVNIMGTVFSTSSTSIKENKPETNSISKIEAIEHNFNRFISAHKIQRQPGVYCSTLSNGDDCHFEAEWNLNGNLFCASHFKDQVKMCEENGTGVKIEDV
jgi:hypothetical protein